LEDSYLDLAGYSVLRSIALGHPELLDESEWEEDEDIP
jgi:hypothetical protein